MYLPSIRFARRVRVGWSAISLFLLAACASSGPAGNPLGQSLTWFTYAAGTDIRGRCRTGAPDEYRFVYNGQYEHQIRAYDLQARPDGGAELLARARGRQGDLGRFGLNDPLGPWALEQRRSVLSAADLAALVAALDRDAAVTPPAGGQRLNSYEFYWLVSRCRRGAFRLDAFLHPRMALANLAFPAELLALDGTGVPFRLAQPFEGGKQDSFQLHINRRGDGLAGPLIAF